MYQGLNCFGFSLPGRKQIQPGSFPRTLMLPSATEMARKMPRDGTSHCQVLVQNSYIREVTNTRPIPSDFSKTKQQEPFPVGQAWRAQQLPGCCLQFLIPKGCFPLCPSRGSWHRLCTREQCHTLMRWLSLSMIVATLIKMGFRLSTASNFVLTWNP